MPFLLVIKWNCILKVILSLFYKLVFMQRKETLWGDMKYQPSLPHPYSCIQGEEGFPEWIRGRILLRGEECSNPCPEVRSQSSRGRFWTFASNGVSFHGRRRGRARRSPWKKKNLTEDKDEKEGDYVTLASNPSMKPSKLNAKVELMDQVSKELSRPLWTTAECWER